VAFAKDTGVGRVLLSFEQQLESPPLAWWDRYQRGETKLWR